jgi:hypothetical protein
MHFQHNGFCSAKSLFPLMHMFICHMPRCWVTWVKDEWMDAMVMVPMWSSLHWNAMMQGMDKCYDEDWNHEWWGGVDNIHVVWELEMQWLHDCVAKGYERSMLQSGSGLYTSHTCWCGPPVNDFYQQGALLKLIQPVRTTDCNQCWYSPFIGDPHQ